MAQQSSTIELAKDTGAKVVEQLAGIVGSKAFRQADRLKRFLSFIVEETIAPWRTPQGVRGWRPALVSRNTAVVIPFADHSAVGDQRYFCEGLTQEIIHALAGTDDIRLVAWNEGAPAALQMAIRAAAERSNAALIVTGSVRKAGEDVRITMTFN